MTRLIVSVDYIEKTALINNPFDLFDCDFDAEIERLAKEKSQLCHTININADSYQQAYIRLVSFVSRLGINAPEISDNISFKGAVSRMSATKWWRRSLYTLLTREMESISLVDNKVNSHNEIYISNDMLFIQRERKQRNRRMLEQLVATNEAGEQLTVAELADSSISNPINRRNEMMCRIAGLDKTALELGHTGLFWTITCPSRMHSSLNKSGKANPKYDETNPREAQAYLCKVWAKIRAKLHRNNIKIYGMRVAEPQHDGTPHWHILVFLPANQANLANEVVRGYALEEDRNERGAALHRFTVETIDRSKGSAVSYLAKYISKNVDGHAVGTDLYGHDAIESAERVIAWASTWGIRQFQFIGSPPVSVYRELRKLKTIKGEEHAIEAPWQAANTGDWHMYINSMGGIGCGREDYLASLSKGWCDDDNQYGDPIGWIIEGVEAKGTVVCTRLHTWRVEMVFPSLSQPENRLDEAPPNEEREAPWSSVNNCTDSFDSSPIHMHPN